MTDETSTPFSNFALNQLTNPTTPTNPRQHFNPRPSGILQSGSATHAVRDFLASKPGRFMTTAQIIWGTGRTNKSVDWGLRMLRSLNMLEMRRDDRSARNWKYCLKVDHITKP